MANGELRVGGTFATWNEFAEKYESFLRKTYHPIFVFKKTITAATHNKHYPQYLMPLSCGYYHVAFECIHGRKRKGTSKGLRRVQNVLKMNCTAQVLIRYSIEQKLFQITQWDLDHVDQNNVELHKISEHQFKKYNINIGFRAINYMIPRVVMEYDKAKKIKRGCVSRIKPAALATLHTTQRLLKNKTDIKQCKEYFQTTTNVPISNQQLRKKKKDIEVGRPLFIVRRINSIGEKMSLEKQNSKAGSDGEAISLDRQNSNASSGDQRTLLDTQNTNATSGDQRTLLDTQNTNASSGDQRTLLDAQNTNASSVGEEILRDTQNSNTSSPDEEILLDNQISSDSSSDEELSLDMQISNDSSADEEISLDMQTNDSSAGEEISLDMQTDSSAGDETSPDAQNSNASSVGEEILLDMQISNAISGDETSRDTQDVNASSVVQETLPDANVAKNQGQKNRLLRGPKKKRYLLKSFIVESVSPCGEKLNQDIKRYSIIESKIVVPGSIYVDITSIGSDELILL